MDRDPPHAAADFSERGAMSAGADRDASLDAKPVRIGLNLWLFVCIHFVAWFILSFLRPRPHTDSLEAMAWGLTWEWGTNKHPPLTGWLLDLAYRLIGDADVAIYAMAQLCVVVALVYVYKFSARFVAAGDALLCALFLEGTVYYTVNSMNYNPNSLSLALVPVVVYYFHLAVCGDRARHWLLAGLFAGLSLLTKYTNGIALLALFLYLALTSVGRSKFRRIGPYLAFVAAVLVFLPHVLWLVRYDFAPSEYSRHRFLAASGIMDWVGRGISNLLVVFFGQFLKAAASIGLFAFLYFRTPRAARAAPRRVDPLLLCAGILPAALTAVSMMVSGTHAYPKYAYAFIGYFSLLLFAMFPVTAAPAARRTAIRLTYAVMVAFLIYTALSITVGYKPREFNSRAFTAAVEAELGDRDSPVVFAGGEEHLVSATCSYLSPRPRPFFEMNPNVVVWEDEADILSKPVLVLAYSREGYQRFRGRYPRVPGARHIVVPTGGFFRKTKIDLYIGVMEPVDNAGAEMP